VAAWAALRQASIYLCLTKSGYFIVSLKLDLQDKPWVLTETVRQVEALVSDYQGDLACVEAVSPNPETPERECVFVCV